MYVHYDWAAIHNVIPLLNWKIFYKKSADYTGHELLPKMNEFCLQKMQL